MFVIDELMFVIGVLKWIVQRTIQMKCNVMAQMRNECTSSSIYCKCVVVMQTEYIYYMDDQRSKKNRFLYSINCYYHFVLVARAQILKHSY